MRLMTWISQSRGSRVRRAVVCALIVGFLFGVTDAGAQRTNDRDGTERKPVETGENPLRARGFWPSYTSVNGSPGMRQFIPEWRPNGGTLRFSLHGDYQVFQVAKSKNGAQDSLVALQHTLTLEPDIQITDTFRLHARYRPILNEKFLFEDGVDRGDERLQRAFFEGKFAGFDVAGGRVPLEFHNLYLAQDDVLGGMIAKNNLTPFGLPNMRLLAFATASGGFSELDGRAGRKVGLYGIDAVIDSQKYITEVTFAYLRDEVGKNQNEGFGGLSIVRIQPRQSTSIRAFANWNEENQKTGGLFIIENSYIFPSEYLDRPTWYTNAFYGTSDYRSMASGSLKNLGVLFNQLNLMPQLKNNGVDSAGFATGILLGRSRDFTVTPEFSMVFDQSQNKNNQYGGGIRLQTRLMDTSFLRVDLIAFHQDIDVKSITYASSALVVYKF